MRGPDIDLERYLSLKIVFKICLFSIKYQFHMSVSYQISSDLHIENFEDDVDPLKLITPKADVLILAGDIGSLYKYEQLFRFINNLVNHFKFILYIPGNHEYYT